MEILNMVDNIKKFIDNNIGSIFGVVFFILVLLGFFSDKIIQFINHIKKIKQINDIQNPKKVKQIDNKWLKILFFILWITSFSTIFVKSFSHLSKTIILFLFYSFVLLPKKSFSKIYEAWELDKKNSRIFFIGICVFIVVFSISIIISEEKYLCNTIFCNTATTSIVIGIYHFIFYLSSYPLTFTKKKVMIKDKDKESYIGIKFIYAAPIFMAKFILTVCNFTICNEIFFLCLIGFILYYWRTVQFIYNVIMTRTKLLSNLLNKDIFMIMIYSYLSVVICLYGMVLCVNQIDSNAYADQPYYSTTAEVAMKPSDSTAQIESTTYTVKGKIEYQAEEYKDDEKKEEQPTLSPEKALDLLYYTVITFSTVGYGDITPQTLLAKIIAILISLSSIFCLIVSIGTFTSALGGSNPDQSNLQGTQPPQPESPADPQSPAE